MSISKKDLASERRTRHCRKPQRCVYYAAWSILSYNGTCDQNRYPLLASAERAAAQRPRRPAEKGD